MVLAKPAGKNLKRELAQQLAERLRQHADIVSAEVAGPGFLNLKLVDAFWHARLAEILRAGPAYGDSGMGQGRRVNVEFVSANPTGPLTAGHARGAVVGDALAGLLAKAGYEVSREYYINDAGAQVDVLARSTYLRYREALGETIGEIPPRSYYPGDYLKPVGKALAERDGKQMARRARERMAAGSPTVRRRRLDGRDPRGPGGTWHPHGCVQLRAPARRSRRSRSRAEDPRRPRLALSRRAGAA